MTARPRSQPDAELGHEMHALITELFPICRSITGQGVRHTLSRLQQCIPLEVHEVPSGTRVLDWTVPAEWNVQGASITTLDGRRVVDFQDHNLHLVSYSHRLQSRLSLAELNPHLHSLPDHPEWIPYRASYYHRDWGFCLPHEQRLQLGDELYEVRIDAQHDDQGSLTYGELLLPGKSPDEVLFSCHICHPSLANDNLSSLAVAVQLAQYLARQPRRYSYRFLFAPGTIGALTWLAQNPDAACRVKHGLVLALLGHAYPLTYKKTRSGNERIDRILQYVLRHGDSALPPEILDFYPGGYDERQFGSPGIQLPVGRLSRSVEGGYPEYHTSADNLALVRPCYLHDALEQLKAVVDCLETDRMYRNRLPQGEPQLGRRGLYPATDTSGESSSADFQEALLWNLNGSDGHTGLCEISGCSGLPLAIHQRAADLLVDQEILEEIQDAPLERPADNSHGHPSQASQELNRRAHELIPGGAHTYAKGDDQFPINAPRFFERGTGCRVFDSDGNEFIEYGCGLRSVTLGHAFPRVVQAAYRQMQLGSNFTRPTTLEQKLADDFLGLLPAADMVKFTKNGSDATTAAIRLARAQTGREKILLCGDHPFFSVDDWFIGTTAMDAGIPSSTQEAVVRFPYGDLPAVRRLFDQHPGEFACLIMEATTYHEPPAGYLHDVQTLCRQHGTLFVLDEMITGFRWHIGGAQVAYDLQPDLSTFGKAMGNGFSVAALVGRREHMELGGVEHQRPRVFLLSYTHGAEAHCLAAARETLHTYQQEPVIETLYRRGEQLREELNAITEELGIQQHFSVQGRACNLIYVTRDKDGQRSQLFRTLLLQELIQAGVFAPSLVVSYAHRESDLERTCIAFRNALTVYQRALADGVEHYLHGRPSQPVFRKWN